MTTPHIQAPGRKVLIGALFALTLAGCASHLRPPAPLENRAPNARSSDGDSALAPRPPGYENSGKPGYYTVKPGDTLIRIGLESGQNWRDIQRWNQLDNPDVIEVGQVLRVVSPNQDPTQVTTRPVVTSRVEPRPIDTRPAPAPAPVPVPVPAVPTPAPPPVAQTPSVAAPAPSSNAGSGSAASASAGEEAITWMWPAQGGIIAGFEETRSKGVAIGGKAGDSVFAAADGRVVYAGSGLRGYGNLVIIKHSETLLTAYAHNQALLVREDQVVRRGQKIAEMGSSDADRVKLHFEVRRRGKPIDPTKVLPAR